MLRWMFGLGKAKAKKLKAKAKRRVAAVRVRRSTVSNNARFVRNIVRMA
jgi:hypothetical protein